MLILGGTGLEEVGGITKCGGLEEVGVPKMRKRFEMWQAGKKVVEAEETVEMGRYNWSWDLKNLGTGLRMCEGLEELGGFNK